MLGATLRGRAAEASQQSLGSKAPADSGAKPKASSHVQRLSHLALFQRCAAATLLLAAAIVGIVALVIQAQIWRFEALQIRGGADWDWYTLRLKFFRRCPRGKPANADLPEPTCTAPPIIVLEGRAPEALNAAHAASWAPLQPTRLNVRPLSTSLSDVPGCDPPTWENRLFTVYRATFELALSDFPNAELFIFVEDDVRLIDEAALRREICWQVEHAAPPAWKRTPHFFSFFRAGPDPSTAPPERGCLYFYGTQAFLLNRAMLQHLLRVPARTMCRMPIDLYIKTLGPWHVPDAQFVLHEGTRTRVDLADSFR